MIDADSLSMRNCESNNSRPETHGIGTLYDPLNDCRAAGRNMHLCVTGRKVERTQTTLWRNSLANVSLSAKHTFHAAAFSMSFPFLEESQSYNDLSAVIILPSRAALLTIFPSSSSSKPHNKIRRCISHASHSNFRFVPRISVSRATL